MKKLTGIEQLQQKNKKPKDKKPKRKIDKIVNGLFIYWITFVSLCFITFWVKGEEPVTLITYGLGGSVLELVITAVLKIIGDKYENKEA